MDKLVDKYAMDSLNHRYLENLDMNQNLQVYTCGPTSIIQVGQRHGRVNCFDVTGNLIIVIECKISAFFKKKKMVAGAHVRIAILLNGVKRGKNGPKMGKILTFRLFIIVVFDFTF